MSKRFLIGLALLPLLACQVPEPESSFELTRLAFPAGNPHAGREAFLDLGCAACHRVTWEDELPAPVSPVAAPEFRDHLTRQTAGNVATSIILPSHNVPPEVREPEDSLSPMGDFQEAMTVRQLIDVVSYLRTQGGQTVAQSHRPTDIGRPPF